MPILSLIYTTSLRSLPSSKAEEHAKLRHIAADLLFVAGEVSGVPSPTIKSPSFYHKIGVKWHELRKFDLASSCFERATDLLSKIEIDTISDAGEKKLFLDLSNARSKTAWEVSDRNLALALLNIESSSLNEALKLMNEALELYEKGLRVARTREETADLKASRSKTLRFISAVHLQMNEFESVIKCVRVLQDGDAGDQHPSLPMMAMKAWLGLGKYGEAEKELRGMVVNNGIPEKAMLYIRGLVAQGHGGSLLR